MPFMAFSEVRICEGMQWKSFITGTSTPEGVISTETIKLKSCMCDKTPSLGLFVTDISDKDNEPLVYIKIEGDKVWFKPVAVNSTDWFLMYDFGLRPGEGCYLYFPEKGNINPKRSYVECTATGTDQAEGTHETMTLREYKDETKCYCLGEGTWLKGLTSYNGILGNIGFNLDGMSSRLIEISVGEELLFKQEMPESGIKALLQPEISIEGDELTVKVELEGETCSIYTVEGNLITNFEPARPVSIKLPKGGVYILRIGKRAWKFVR